MNFAQMTNMYPAGVTVNGKQATVNVPLYPHTWVFAGKPCTVYQFADLCWPEDCVEKTHFILKWEGRKITP